MSSQRCRRLPSWSRKPIRLRRWGVVDSNMVVEDDSRRNPFPNRTPPTSQRNAANARTCLRMRPCHAAEHPIVLAGLGGLVGLDETGQDSAKVIDVRSCQGFHKVAPDAFQVFGPNLLESSSSGRGKRDVESAAILAADRSADECVPFHAIEQAEARPLRLSAWATTIDSVNSCSVRVCAGAHARWTKTSNSSRLRPERARSVLNCPMIKAFAH